MKAILWFHVMSSAPVMTSVPVKSKGVVGAREECSLVPGFEFDLDYAGVLSAYDFAGLVHPN